MIIFLAQSRKINMHNDTTQHNNTDERYILALKWLNDSVFNLLSITNHNT